MGALLRLPSPIPSHDLFFIVLHSVVDTIALAENIILLLAIVSRSPPNLRSYAILLMYSTCIDLVAAFSSGMIMVRLIAVGDMVAYVYDGPCVAFSNFFCHCCYTLTLVTLSQSMVFVAVSFAYRLYVLDRRTPHRWQVLLVCLAVSAPNIAVLTPYVFALDNSQDVRTALALAKPEYDLDGYEIEGHLSVYSLVVASSIAACSVPSTPAVIAVIVLRAKVLTKIRSQSSQMSGKTMRMHQSFTKVLTIQATLPAFFLFGVLNYYSCQSGLLCSPLQEHFIVQSGSLIPLISPAVTLFYVQPYRSFVEVFLCCKKTIKRQSIDSIGDSAVRKTTW